MAGSQWSWPAQASGSCLSKADGWLLCPSCATRLRRRCSVCDRLVELTWDICAWGGRDFRPAPAAEPSPAAQPASKPEPTADLVAAR